MDRTSDSRSKRKIEDNRSKEVETKTVENSIHKGID